MIIHGNEILLIEDNTLDRELTIRSFHENGFNGSILVAVDGAEAINLITGAILSNLKLVLVDLKLPKVDGFDVIKAVRACERTRLLPVVVFTSSEEENDIRRSYEAGANSYVVKPITYDEINSTILAVGKYWSVLNKTVRGGPISNQPATG